MQIKKGWIWRACSGKTNPWWLIRCGKQARVCLELSSEVDTWHWRRSWDICWTNRLPSSGAWLGSELQVGKGSQIDCSWTQGRKVRWQGEFAVPGVSGAAGPGRESSAWEETQMTSERPAASPPREESWAWHWVSQRKGDFSERRRSDVQKGHVRRIEKSHRVRQLEACRDVAVSSSTKEGWGWPACKWLRSERHTGSEWVLVPLPSSLGVMRVRRAGGGWRVVWGKDRVVSLMFKLRWLTFSWEVGHRGKDTKDAGQR